MPGTMSMEVLKLRREEMPREAELNRLKKALRAGRKRSAVFQRASIVAWDIERVSTILRTFFRMPKEAD